MQSILLFYLLPVVLTFVLMRGEPDSDELMFAIIPGFHFILFLGAIWQATIRIFQSKGKCTFGHNYSSYDPHTTHRKTLKMLEVLEKVSVNVDRSKIRVKHPPMRAPMGGIDHYECEKCYNKISKSWSAF